MHRLSRIKTSQDPWEKVVLVSLQQLTEDMRLNEKRVGALEKSIATLRDVLVGSSSTEEQDLNNAPAALQELHEDIRAWSKQSLDRAEELAVLVRHLVYDRELGPAIVCPSDTKRLAG